MSAFLTNRIFGKKRVEGMKQTEEQKESTNGGQGEAWTPEAKAHHYDASKYERPSVTVDVVMMSLRQRDLQVLLVKRRSWPYEEMWAIPGGFVKMDESLVTAASDAADVGWFSLYNLPPLAFDHGKILQYALNRLRGKLDYTTIAFSLLPEQFTLRELQRVYEIILHRKLDKRNFRKKVLATGILEDTGAKKMEGTHRPAGLYRFNPAAERKL